MSSDSDGWLARDLKLVTRAVESRHQAISRADEANADLEKTKQARGSIVLQTRKNINRQAAPYTHALWTEGASIIESLCRNDSSHTDLRASLVTS